MLLWEGDHPDLEFDLRGLGRNEFLSLQNPDVLYFHIVTDCLADVL